MNEITKQAIDAAAAKNKSLGKAAREIDEHHIQFHWKVQEEWNTIILVDIGWQAYARAAELWKPIHPEYYDDEGFLDPEIEQRYFSPMLEEFIEWKIEQHPELQLTDYKEYLSKLFPKQLELF